MTGWPLTNDHTMPLARCTSRGRSGSWQPVGDGARSNTVMSAAARGERLVAQAEQLRGIEVMRRTVSA
jgi:hypothetical protein